MVTLKSKIKLNRGFGDTPRKHVKQAMETGAAVIRMQHTVVRRERKEAERLWGLTFPRTVVCKCVSLFFFELFILFPVQTSTLHHNIMHKNFTEVHVLVRHIVQLTHLWKSSRVSKWRKKKKGRKKRREGGRIIND